MKIFSKCITVHISKLHLDNFKGNFLSIFASSDSRFSNSYVSANIVQTNHTSMESLFIQLAEDV